VFASREHDLPEETETRVATKDLDPRNREAIDSVGIDNAAREPEIVDLCEMLVAMGASIGSGALLNSSSSADPLSLIPAITSKTDQCPIERAESDSYVR